MQALNKWVVRSENLKKYNVIKQVGEGGQAKVYKVIKKKRVGDARRVSYEDKVYAMKVIDKDRLKKQHIYE